MLDAALFRLKAAAIEEPQFRLGLTMLENAIAGSRDGVNAARVNDIEFALHDLAATVDFLSAEEAERVREPLELLRQDVESLRATTALAPEVIARIGALVTKLRARSSAVEKQTYQEGGGGEPLPHQPEELKAEAVPLARELAAAGFVTPALDALIEDPGSLRLHGMREILDELEVIAH